METAAAFLTQVLTQYPFKIEKFSPKMASSLIITYWSKERSPRTRYIRSSKSAKSNRSEHRRTTLVKHPWTNGMVEAMDKKIKENTVKRFQYDVEA